MTRNRVDEVFSEFLVAIEAVDLAYAVIGGYAVVTWGVPRATYDVDVLIEDVADRMPALFDACEARGFSVDDAYRSGWRDQVRDMPLVKVQLFRGGRAVSCDVFPASTAFQQSAFARRSSVRIPSLGRDVPVITAADLVLFKLLANRPKDRIDVQNVIAVQGVPDETYLRDWARQLGLERRLDDAIASLGE